MLHFIVYKIHTALQVLTKTSLENTCQKKCAHSPLGSTSSTIYYKSSLDLIQRAEKKSLLQFLTESNYYYTWIVFFSSNTLSYLFVNILHSLCSSEHGTEILFIKFPVSAFAFHYREHQAAHPIVS